MQEIVSKEKCTGCTACFNICPHHAISMQYDEEGFQYPVIDQEKCVNCGACKKICPVLNQLSKDSLNKCYVGFHKNEMERENASSGAIFSLLANMIIEQEGIVIGAAFDEKKRLKHIAIQNIEDLEKLKKSKYVQSELNDIFQYVKQNINNRKILFVGTPCQVAGLKSYVKENQNLICVDLFCHGVPSPKLFEKYIQELENTHHDKVISYDFRDNTTGWDSYSNTITFHNKKITQSRRKNVYMKLFLSDMALRKSCYDCNFKIGNKYSDITIGDFWGVKKYYPEMYNKKGVSAIIVNTDKGMSAFENIKNDLEWKECKLEEITSGNAFLKKSPLMPSKREDFFRDLNVSNMEQLCHKYVKKQSIIKKIRRKISSIVKSLFF